MKMTEHVDPTAVAMARRKRVMAPTYRLFYEEPLYVTRAQGAWMYDVAGNRYLDAYNNVPVVGHCHPYVVECMSRQAALFNTHTRYLTDPPLELAERLLATLPAEIGCATFTCSGSEANDLAIRVSKSVTGGEGIIISEYAYHGTTETLAGMSPAAGLPTAPNVFKARITPDTNDGADFGRHVDDAIGRMRAAGVRPAALIVDTIFGSDGVASGPVGFLAPAAASIRAAGGLFIADEVQPGFGRTGEAMWGFLRHAVVPDLVTMGKPMGNGYPVAALCARRPLMEEFARSARYFNTFGGNSVACAAALAVLDVLARERLLENALAMGQRMKKGLERLAERHESIVSIRGAGLFVGVQLRSAVETTRVVNGMRRQGVLLGSAGGQNDALKIRPPLVVTAAEIEDLIATLDGVLRDDEGAARESRGGG
jgi:4-aminobutyrate aminotransferase-like enzyme